MIELFGEGFLAVCALALYWLCVTDKTARGFNGGRSMEAPPYCPTAHAFRRVVRREQP